MYIKRTAFLAVIFILLCIELNASDVLMSRFDAGNSGVSPDNVSLPLTKLWEHTTNRYQNNPVSPIIVSGVAYFSSGDRAYAVNIDNGSLVWRYPREQGMGGNVRVSPVYHNGKVYFASTDNNLYCLDAKTGDFKWMYQTRGPIRCAPVIDDGIIYFGSSDNSVYAVYAETGELAWNRPFTAKDDVIGAVALGAGMVVVTSIDGHAYGINASTGRLRWVFRIPIASSNTHPVISESVVAIGAGNMLYGLAVRSGQLRWAITLPADVAAAPAIDGTDIYIPCRNRKLYAYTAIGRTFSSKWIEPFDIVTIPKSSPTIAGDTIIITGSKGFVSAASKSDGAVKWRYIVAPSKVTAPNADVVESASPVVVADGAMYMLTDDGVLHSFRNEAPDTTVPEIYILSPYPGISMNGSPPISFGAILYDIGSGIDWSSVSLEIDGQPVEQELDIERSTIKYTTPMSEEGKPAISLPNGIHTVSVSGKDYRGNLLKREWFFIVDNSLPAPRKITPTPPAGAPTPAPTGRRGSRGNRTGTTNTPTAQPQPPAVTAPGAELYTPNDGAIQPIEMPPVGPDGGPLETPPPPVFEDPGAGIPPPPNPPDMPPPPSDGEAPPSAPN
ncbi:MAG: PQQ-binding-like beta-propeller repeat protein [Armatimonadota bacterium]